MKIITQLSCLEIKNKIEKEYESSKQPSTFFLYKKKKTGKTLHWFHLFMYTQIIFLFRYLKNKF